MKVGIETLAGSTYVLDIENKSWKRIRKAEASGVLRTEDGVFENDPKYDFTIIGDRLTLVCPPIVEGTTKRLISTSPVTNIFQYIEPIAA